MHTKQFCIMNCHLNCPDLQGKRDSLTEYHKREVIDRHFINLIWK